MNNTNINESEVARLRQQIADEHEAMQRAISAPMVGASHQFINARMDRFASATEALINAVGPERAAPIIVGIMDE